MIEVAIDARVTKRMSFGMRAYLDALLAGLPRVAPDVRVHAIGGSSNFSVAEQIGLPRALARTKSALVHYPTTYAPMMRRTPYVTTVHDLIHLDFPKLFGPAVAAHYALIGGPLLRGAQRLVMGDPRTVQACERHLGIAPEHCRVVPLGYDPALLTSEERYPHPQLYVLYAGNHRPHKNLIALYTAWSLLPQAMELDILVTGPDDAAARAAFAHPNRKIIFLGDVDRRTLGALYRGAAAYVHPALAEGFGIPMLEALALGTPVLASATSVPSIVEPFAHTFGPHDIGTLRALLADVYASPPAYRRRAAEGSIAVRSYTWDRFAAATAAVYREVVNV